MSAIIPLQYVLFTLKLSEENVKLNIGTEDRTFCTLLPFTFKSLYVLEN